jgi:hypothetical protein
MNDLSQVKPGAKLLRSIRSNTSVVTVEKVNKNHIVVSGGKKYRRKDGWAVGVSTWDADVVRPYVEEEWQAYRKKQQETKLRRDLIDYNWMNLDIEIVRQIHALLPMEVEPS